MIAIVLGLSIDVGAPWLWVACGLFSIGLIVATVRKTLGGFSRRALQERLTPERREKYLAYFDRLDDYSISLRILDQGARLGLIGCAVLPFINPEPPAGDAIVSLLRNLASFLLLMLCVVVVVLVGLELVPSILARISPERLMIRTLPALDLLYHLTGAPIKIYDSVVAAGARAIGSQPPRARHDVVEEEILSAAADGEREGLLEKSEITMIEAIFRFHDRFASEVLTPRTDMVAIDASTPLSACVSLARECGHSRIPVYEGNKDAIVGILYVKDLLKYWERRDDEAISLKDIVREAHFVPENKKISELFHEFKAQRFHIAIVVDEFGGTSGLITIEDVIEEILGEIEDEFESEDDPRRLVRVAEDEVEIDARLAIADLNSELRDVLPVTIPEGDGFDTVGGFLFSSLGKIPALGDVFTFGPLRFEIVAADERTIRRVRMRIVREGAGTNTG